LAVFAAFLSATDAKRASDVIEKLLANGLRECALTGGLAIEAQLRAHGRPIHRGALNDLDIAVESFGVLPAALADRWILSARAAYNGRRRAWLLVIWR
jgi:hypothetical protein